VSKSATPSEAASILLTTADGTVLVGQRARSIPFLGSYLSFPGGRVEDEDHALAARLFPGDPLAVRKIAGLRELEEETGLTVDGPHAVRAEGDFATRLANVDLSRFVPAGRWVTPDYSPVRYDTHFFQYVVDDFDEPTVGVESPEFEWLRFEPADKLVREWYALQHLLSPPALVALECLQYGAAEAPRRILQHPGARAEDHHEFEALPDVRIYALRTPTLPPAETTNAVAIGRERILVVDPATYDDDERDKLLVHLEALTARGATIEAIVLTHHHFDHVGAAKWLAPRVGAPVIAHAITKELLGDKIRIDATIEEGHVFDLGTDRRGEPFTVEVLHTPGHAPGHVVLVDRRPGARLMIVGDMVAAIGTIIVDPPEGNMAEYLRQLERLAAMDESILIPAHGPPIVEGRRHLKRYVAHRRMRESKVVAALEHHGRGSASELLDVAYDDTPKHLYPLAARSCLAHLEKLVEDGRAIREGDRFRLASDSGA
jgi:ribonuclease/clavin/mitogillin